ncbi:MAG: PCRF domain-containing protein, partial [Oscillospiraceae bacterium]|nr:PCRF domain-containing protein [Oscillospiraceae bacterium]
MFEKLEKIKERFEEVYRLLQLPETVSDQELYRDLNKEYKNLTPVVEEFDRYLASKKEAEEAEDALAADAALPEEIEEEVPEEDAALPGEAAEDTEAEDLPDEEDVF